MKDRYDYKVNNAYLLRNIYYAENYFLMKQLYLKINDLQKFIAFTTALPNDLSAAKELIADRLTNKINP